MTLKEFYAQIGGNYEDTLHRLPSEALVHRFVLKYPADPSVAQLRDSVSAADWETAFRAAHTLKVRSSLVDAASIAVVSTK